VVALSIVEIPELSEEIMKRLQYWLLCILLCPLLGLPVQDTARADTLYSLSIDGNLYSYTYANGQWGGLSSSQVQWVTTIWQPVGGGSWKSIALANGYGYAAYGSRLMRFTLSPVTSETYIGDTGYSTLSGMALHPNGTMYVSYSAVGGQSAESIGTIDLSTGSITHVFSSPRTSPYWPAYTHIAFDNNANLYALDTYIKKLYQISLTNGTETELCGSLSCPSGGNWGMDGFTVVNTAYPFVTADASLGDLFQLNLTDKQGYFGGQAAFHVVALTKDGGSPPPTASSNFYKVGKAAVFM
jgi:hypothetical protein